MAAQGTRYFTKVIFARYRPVMTELLEANERSQTEQGTPDSKKQDKKMQIGVDSFAAQFADESESVNASASKSVRQLVERIEFAEQVGLDVFGVGEHHRREFLDSAPALILAAAAARTKRIRLTSAVTVLSAADPVRVFESFATLDLLSHPITHGARVILPVEVETSSL